MTTKCKCKQCGQVFPCEQCGDSVAFDNHECPATPPCVKGENWESYKARCDAFKAEYDKRNA